MKIRFTLMPVALLAASLTWSLSAGDTITPFDLLQSRANALMEKGGFTAIGMAKDAKDEKSWVVEMATDSARVSMVRNVKRVAEVQRRDFYEEIGLPTDPFDIPLDSNPAVRGSGSSRISLKECDVYFNAMEAYLVHYAMCRLGLDEEDQLAETRGDMVSVWVLLRMDPVVVLEAAHWATPMNPNVAKRYRASQAYLEMLEDLERYAPERSQ